MLANEGFILTPVKLFLLCLEKHIDMKLFDNVKSYCKHAIYACCLLQFNMKSDTLEKHACKNPTSKLLHFIQ